VSLVMINNSFTPPDEDLRAGLPGLQEVRRAEIEIIAPKNLMDEPVPIIDDGCVR